MDVQDAYVHDGSISVRIIIANAIDVMLSIVIISIVLSNVVNVRDHIVEDVRMTETKIFVILVSQKIILKLGIIILKICVNNLDANISTRLESDVLTLSQISEFETVINIVSNAFKIQKIGNIN
jgi:hypothetical protein